MQSCADSIMSMTNILCMNNAAPNFPIISIKGVATHETVTKTAKERVQQLQICIPTGNWG